MRTNRRVDDPNLRRLLAWLLCEQRRQRQEQRRCADTNKPWPLDFYHTGVMRGMREACAEICFRRSLRGVTGQKKQ